MTDRTYADLYSLIGALAGVDNFTPSEQASILAFVNRRLFDAYNRSPVWPRYVVGAQARPASESVIASTYDHVAGVRSVSTATRSGTTVNVVCTADVDFVAGMRVTIAGLTGTQDPNGTFTVTSVDDDTFEYELANGTGSETYGGTGTVSPVAVPEIYEWNRVWRNNPLNLMSGCELEFYVDSDGAHVIGNWGGFSGFWVGFKKVWGGPYTILSTDIPQEFFYFTAHGAYADFLRMDGQTDKGMMEEREAERYLTIELEKASTQKNVNRLFTRISTHNSRQHR
jgi:hypothetical protein